MIDLDAPLGHHFLRIPAQAQRVPLIPAYTQQELVHWTVQPLQYFRYAVGNVLRGVFVMGIMFVIGRLSILSRR